jgi:nicotinate-nucleotide adenylyltransferase
LLTLADVAVAGRPGVAAGWTALPGLPRERFRFLEMEPIEVSSSIVRQLAGRGEPIEELVGGAVAGYIAEHGLYRQPARTVA